MKKQLTLCLVALLALCCLSATIVTIKISQYPLTTTPGTNDLFLIAVAGVTNKSIKYSDLKASVNATNVNGSGTANTLATWTGTNKLASIANGEGILVNDGSGGFLWTTNVGQIAEAIIYNNTYATNQFFISGKGNTLIITQVVQF